MILVVDHDPRVLETARQILNRDRRVFLASSPAKAVEMAQRLDFSVALVDLDLPAVYLLIEKLRETIPLLLIIAVAGTVRMPIEEARRELGVVEILEKPIGPAWKPVVERVLARRFD
jgi:CheY-like chemotaxis protein